MNFLRALWAGLFHRRTSESEMAEELRFHIDQRAADLQRRGMTAAEAARHARVEFGGVEGYKEHCREARGFRAVDEASANVRYAFRSLRTNPVFTASAVLSLAVGIGVNLSCFAALHAMVLRPFAYPELQRIVTVSEGRLNSPSDHGAAPVANYLDWKRSTGSFEHLGAYRDWDVNLTGTDRPDHVHGALASAEFFAALGLTPQIGRTFGEAECEPGSDGVLVVSEGFWQTRLGGTAEAIGRTLMLSGRAFTVIGVMPKEFNLPLAAELWAPLALTPEAKADRVTPQLSVIGRLKRGVSVEQANADLESVSRRLEEAYATNEGRRARVRALTDLIDSSTNRFVAVLVCAAMFVLLLACTNTASLQVARAAARQKELGLRRALGASQRRIFGQLLTESVMIGLAAGVLGLALAEWDLRMLRANIPPMVYRIVAGLNEMDLNVEAALYCLALSLIASVVCCVPAAFHVARAAKKADLNEALKEGSRSSTGSPTRSRLRGTLVVAEVALAFILLVGAGLMAGGLERMMTMDLGYDTRNVLTANVSLSRAEYSDVSKARAFYDGVLQKVASMPHAEGAAAEASLGPAQAVWVEGRAVSRPDEPRPEIRAVSPGYAKALRLPLVEGRWISEQETPESPLAVVLSASMARHYWPDGGAVGARVRLGSNEGPWLRVVGIAGDAKDWFLGQPIALGYVSYRQFPQTSMRLMVRSQQDSRSLAGGLRSAAEAMDGDEPLYDVRTLEQQMHEETSGVRNAARAMSMYAGIALLLAVTGIYSISSFFVAQRTREIGVRISLGATRRSILAMVLRQACGMAGVGLAIGLPVALVLALGMSRVLYNVVVVGPGTFVVFIAVLAVAAAVAGYVPAYRAARVDPVVALRSE